MPTEPKRIEVSPIYNSILSLKYGDVYTLDFSGLMKAFSVSHLSVINGGYNMIGIQFIPRFNLTAAVYTGSNT